MFMDLHQIQLTRAIKLILVVLTIVFLCGCQQNDTSDKLSNHYDELNESMRNYLDEKDLPTFSGKYIEVKVKDVIKFNHNGKDIYIYDILFAPIYNQKTVFGGIELSSIDYGNKVKKFYYEANQVYGKLDKSKYTYTSINEIIAERYQFFLEDNTIMYSYSLTDEQFESCLTNIKITITINGYKDEICLNDIKIREFESTTDSNNKIIARMLDGGNQSMSLSAYVEY